MTRHVVVPYPASNSTVRARAIHWIERVAAGDVVVHGPGFGSAPIDRGDPVLLVRNAKRLSRGRSEARLLSGAAPGVYDLDDGLPWDDGNLPGLGRWWKRPFPRSLLARRAAGGADRVVAGNETLANWAEGWCDDVRIVPTCVEPGEYRRRTDWSIGSTPVVGWIGSPATEGYLADIAPALVDVHQRTGARLEIVSGAGTTDARLAPFTTRRVWQPSATEWIADWDVGIMPLRDGVYERAKCGYKLLQYAASGVPVVASPVGVNAALLADFDGLAPTTVDEWSDALVAMIGESAQRRGERAERAATSVEAYSYDRWESAWIEAVGW